MAFPGELSNTNMHVNVHLHQALLGTKPYLYEFLCLKSARFSDRYLKFVLRKTAVLRRTLSGKMD